MIISAAWLQKRIAGALIVFLTGPLMAEGLQPQSSQQGGLPSAAQAQNGGNTSGQPTAQPPQTAPQSAPAPVGTAVAPYEKPVGTAASRPAGAVIAPAKQRRAHSLLIKVGLIAAGAAAIGTVIALSKASSSRPN